MARRLFGRVVVFEIGPEGQAGRRLESAPGVPGGGFGTGMRLAFSVKMDQSRMPDSASIQIWNPAPATERLLQASDTVVRILAGWRDGGTTAVYFGETIGDTMSVDRSSPDHHLKIDCGSGLREIRRASVDEGFAVEMTLAELVDRGAEHLGLSIGKVDLGDHAGDVVPAGYAFSGRVMDELDGLLRIRGIQCYVQNRSLFVLPKGASNGLPATLVSARAGNLVGSPAPVEEGLRWSMLMAPEMRPGRAVRMESADYQGDYLVSSVQHQGDSWDGPYQTECVGRRIRR